MPTAKGIACSLKIEGQDRSSSEYGVQSSDDFASAYVVAKENKRFSLKVATTAWIHPELALFVFMDGVYQNGALWRRLSPENFLKKSSFCYKSETDRESGTVVSFEKAWKFDKLPVVDESALDCEKDFRVLSNLGTIEVVVLRCRSEGGRSTGVIHPPLDAHPHSKPYWKSWAKDLVHVADKPLQPVFEKDIKGRGISHRVATEPEKQVKYRGSYPYPIDSFDNPYCILVIQYRSRAFLQSMGLIPSLPLPSRTSRRTASPKVAQDELELVKELSKEDMIQELLRYRRLELGKPMRNIKQERRGVSNEGARVGKRARKNAGKVVIDLTDD